MSPEVWGLVLLGSLFVVIMIGFPISFTLIFLGIAFGYIALGGRVFYLMTLSNYTTMLDSVLAAVALFTFMGCLLESSGLMERLFKALQVMCGRLRGSLYLGTIVAATLFAAATGIVGASVPIIGLMAGPAMRKSGYDTSLCAGTICAGGTLGILIPPSVMLVVMGPVFSVSVARLYAAAILPGLLLSFLYICYTMGRSMLNPALGPPLSKEELDVPTSYLLRELCLGLIPPAALILATLGSIITGFATPTEGAAVGCLGAVLVTVSHGKFNFAMLKDAAFRTALNTSMVMLLLVAANFVGAVFSACGTPKLIANYLLSLSLPAGVFVVGTLVVCFILGWPLEWVPIVAIILPIFIPILTTLRVDMIWFCILVAVTLQSCWISPPVAASAYYLKAVVPEWELIDIYRGMMPFMILQAIAVAVLYYYPSIVTALPLYFYGR
jgi:tripartite ATP-independent transporter DctM subunit